MTPEELRALIGGAKDRCPVADRAIRTGDIRRLVSGGFERLVVVLALSSASQSVQVTLVHPHVEYATEADLILSDDDTGLGYDIVVQADMRGVAWTADLGRLVGTVEPEVVEECISGTLGAGSSDYPARGPRMAGILDARWDFKASEGEVLRSMVAEATATLLEGRTPWAFDVDEVFGALLSEAPNADRMALALFETWTQRGDDLVFSSGHLEALDRFGMLEPAVWSDALGEVGEHFFRAVLEPMFERVRTADLRAQGGFDVFDSVEVLTSRHLVAR